MIRNWFRSILIFSKQIPKPSFYGLFWLTRCLFPCYLNFSLIFRWQTIKTAHTKATNNEGRLYSEKYNSFICDLGPQLKFQQHICSVTWTSSFKAEKSKCDNKPLKFNCFFEMSDFEILKLKEYIRLSWDELQRSHIFLNI